MQMMELNGLQTPSDGPLSAPSLRFVIALHSRFTFVGSWVGTKGTSGSSVRNQLQSLLSGKCRWIEHSWRMSGKWEKQGTGLVEVVTEVTALRQPIVSELYVRNYKKQWYCEDSTTAETQKSKSNDGLSCGIMRTIVSLFTVMDVCI